MADQFTAVTNISWFTRIKDAFAGLVFGLALFLASFPLLFWNEGRAIKTAKSLTEGASAVVSVGADRVDPANEGKLVHVTGLATTTEALGDGAFGVSATALRLRRKVEMYQWVEKSETKTENQIGGGQVKRTVYSYDKQWGDHSIPSSSFHEPGHANPAALPYPSQDSDAVKATLGAFALPASLLRQINDFSSLAVTADAAQHLSADLQGKLKPAAGSYYQGVDPAIPQVGDVRVSFMVVGPETVSVVSKQFGSTFEPYATQAGRDLDMMETGAHSAPEMFKTSMEQNQTLSWILRFAGFFAMFIGLALLFQPLVVMADILPFLGWIVGAGRTMLAFTVSAGLSLVTIAVAWIAYRPLIGGGLLVVAVAFLAKGMTHRAGPVAAPARA
jgi:hypothetical protein